VTREEPAYASHRGETMRGESLRPATALPRHETGVPPLAATSSPQPTHAPVQPARRSEPQPRQPMPSSEPIGNNRNSGWLSELLYRASRPEQQDGDEDRGTPPLPPVAQQPRVEERPARHSLESLDSLSVDIARMIDHDTAIELWDRYRRGEQNVFTRRLYTLQGQKTFDEIRRKYHSDREFRQTIDRYIGEFERLLQEVARDGRGQSVARSYLTSETGKVYTMLAHAAGRFGETA